MLAVSAARAHNHGMLARRALRCSLFIATVLNLPAARTVAGFPLTMGLGNTSGAREFHFCRLQVTPRPTACTDTLDCLEFASPRGTLWVDVQRTASLAEDAPGTGLLHDMFQYSRQMSLVGDPTLVAQLLPTGEAVQLELVGYWYPSGRRFLLIEVRPPAAHLRP